MILSTSARLLLRVYVTNMPEVEGERRLTFHDVSGQMEFWNEKCEGFASIIKLQQWQINEHSLPQMYGPLTRNVIG